MKWINLATPSDGTLNTLVGFEVGIDSNAKIVRNTGFADNGASLTQQAMDSMLQGGPSRSNSNWYTRLTHIRARGAEEVRLS